MLRNSGAIRRINKTALTTEFRVSHTVAMEAFSAEKYSMKDAANNRTPMDYAQTVIRLGKSAELPAFNQLLQIWNVLDIDFQGQIEKPTKETRISDFLHQLDNKKETWHKMGARAESSKPARNQTANDRGNNRPSQRGMLGANNQRNQNLPIGGYNNFRPGPQPGFQPAFSSMQASNFNPYYQQHSGFQNQNRAYPQQQYYQQQPPYQRNQLSSGQPPQQALPLAPPQKQIAAGPAADSKGGQKAGTLRITVNGPSPPDRGPTMRTKLR